MITGISHIALKIPDIDSVIAFYTEGLGLELYCRAEDSAVLRLPDMTAIEVFSGGKNSKKTLGITHFCLNTYDADKALARAESFGAVRTKEPYTYGALRIAFCKAPSGEEIEFWYIEENGIVREEILGNRYIKSLVHAAFTVKDKAASAKFCSCIGFEPKVDWEWGCSLKLADNREAEIFAGDGFADNNTGIAHVCFYTDSLEATLAKAVSAGAQVIVKPFCFEGIRAAFIETPSGEIFEFFEETGENSMFPRPLMGRKI